MDAAEAAIAAENVAKPAPARTNPAPNAAIPIPIRFIAAANASNGTTTGATP